MKRSDQIAAAWPRVSRRVALAFTGAAVLVLLGAWIYNSIMVARANNAVALDEEQLGVMSRLDYLHWQTTDRGVRASHTITDADLAFQLGLINRPLQASENSIVNVHALSPLVNLKRPTPAQRERILRAILPLMTQTDPTDAQYGNVTAEVAHICLTLKARRAVPQLVPLLNDKRGNVHAWAQLALTAMGYHP